MTVGILCAILIIVHNENSCRVIFWIAASVWESTDAVASSINKIRVCFNMTRPRQRSCLWPTLQFSPLSGTMKIKIKRSERKMPLVPTKIQSSIPGASSFSSFEATTSFSWQRSRAWNDVNLITHGWHKSSLMEVKIIFMLVAIVPAIFQHLNTPQLDQCWLELFLQKGLIPEELCQSEISDRADPVCICLFHQWSFSPPQVQQAWIMLGSMLTCHCLSFLQLLSFLHHWCLH